MNQHEKDQIAKAIYTTLKNVFRRNPAPDLIDLSDRLVDAVELVHSMHSEEVGIADVPRSLQDASDASLAPHRPVSTEWPLEVDRERPRVEPAPPARNAVVKADSPKSALVLPGDPEFNDPTPKKPMRILRPTSSPVKKELEKPCWEEADLINAILSATPEKVDVDVKDREGRTVRLTMNRNVHNQAGMGSVLLTYVHPQVNTQPADASTIIPMGKWSFSVFKSEIDINEAMNGDKGIMIQLKGAYSARPESMVPDSGPEPGPLRLDMRNQPGDFHSEHLVPGQKQLADPYVRNNEILQQTLQRERKENDSLAPMGHRFENNRS